MPKTMLNIISLLATGKEELRRLGDDYSVDLYQRPEDMAIADYVVLAKAMTPLVLPRLGLRP